MKKYIRNRAWSENLFNCWKNVNIYLVYVMAGKKFIIRYEVPGEFIRGYKIYISFNNTALNKKIQKSPASWMFKILFPFVYKKS